MMIFVCRVPGRWRPSLEALVKLSLARVRELESTVVGRDRVAAEQVDREVGSPAESQARQVAGVGVAECG